jgi:hypothetical protein
LPALFVQSATHLLMNEALQSSAFFCAKAGEAPKAIVAESSAAARIAVQIRDPKIALL